MVERSSPAQPVEGKPQTRIGFRCTIRNTLAGRGAVIAILILMAIASACGSSSQDSAAEQQDQKSQLFAGQSWSAERQDQKSRLFATDPFGLESGLVIAKMNHQGNGDFVVNLLSTRQEETAAAPGPIEFSGDQNGGSTTEVARALAKESGPVAISKAVNIPAAGKYILDVKANGPWTIEVEQPRPSGAPKTASFSGNNNVATPFFELSKGLKQITMTNLDEENFGASLLDKNGKEAKVSVLDKHKGPADADWTVASWMLDVGQDGIYLLDVQSDSLWTIEISDVDQPADAEQASSIEQGTNAPTELGTIPVFLINLVWAFALAAVIRFSSA